MGWLAAHGYVLFLAFFLDPVLAFVQWRYGRIPFPFPRVWAFYEAAGVFGALLVRRPADAVIFGCGLLLALACDWRRRRGRRAARALGAKSRAVLAALAEKMREAGSPVPQRVPA